MPLLMGTRLGGPSGGTTYSQTLSSTLDLSAVTTSRVRSTLAASISATTAATDHLAHALASSLSLSSARASALRRSLASTLSLSAVPLVQIRHQVGSTLSLSTAASAQVLHVIAATVLSTLALASTARGAVSTRAGSTLAMSTGKTTALRHTVQRSLALSSHRTSQIGRQLGTTLAFSGASRTLLRIQEASTLAITSAATALSHGFAGVIREALKATRLLAFATLARSLLLTVAPRSQARPLAYTTPVRTTVLMAAWGEEDAMIAVPLRASDAPAYLAPDEVNVAFSVDLADALGTATLTAATLVMARAKYPEEPDGAAVELEDFVSNVIVGSGSQSLTVIAGNAEQVLGTTVELEIALVLNSTPASTWTLYVELPVAKGEPS